MEKPRNTMHDDAFLDDEDSLDGKFLTFRLGKENFAIGIGHVIEIIGIQKVVDVPDMPDYVRGVLNLRDKVIPIMDMRARFRMPAKEDDEETCIIVVCIDERSIGLIVDKVNEVTDIPPERIEPPPGLRGRASNPFLKGMAKMETVIILLDAEKLIEVDEIDHIDLGGFE